MRKTALTGSLGQLIELVTGVVSRRDALESRRGRLPGSLESGVDSGTPVQAPTPDTGGLDDFNAFHGAKLENIP